jgi:hypothetical protein
MNKLMYMERRRLFGAVFLFLAMVFLSGCASSPGGPVDGIYADNNATHLVDLENGSILYMQPTGPGHHQFYRGSYTLDGSRINVTLTHVLAGDNTFQPVNESIGLVLTRPDAHHLAAPDGARLNRLVLVRTPRP